MKPEDNLNARKDLAAQIMKRLNVLPDYIKAFKKNGLIGCSEEPYGFVYWLNDEQKTHVAAFEAQYEGHTVFAAIHGVWKVGCGDAYDIMDWTAYLYVSDEMVHISEMNVKNGFDALKGILDPVDNDKGDMFITAYVEGFFDEFGDIWVRPRNGGLHRSE